MSRRKQCEEKCGMSKAAKASLMILGIGIVTGTTLVIGLDRVMKKIFTLVIGLDRVMKKIFVDEDWPSQEWTNDNWAEEDLED